MLKKGFTLAETIITLGIIGVIVAITTPIVIHSTAKAQVGPKLAKTVAIFEQANAAILQTNNSNSMLAKYYKNNAFDYEKYSAELNNYLKSNITANSVRFVPAAYAVRPGGNWYECDVSKNPDCSTGSATLNFRYDNNDWSSYTYQGDTPKPQNPGGTVTGSGDKDNWINPNSQERINEAINKCSKAWEENRYDAASCEVYCEYYPRHELCKQCSQLEPGSNAYTIKKCTTTSQNYCDENCLPEGCTDRDGKCMNIVHGKPPIGGGTGGGDDNPPTDDDNGEQSGRPSLPPEEKLDPIELPTNWAGLFVKDKSITLNNGISIAYEIKKDYIDAPSKLAPRKQRIGIVAIDINGIKNGKNEIAKDIFAFVMYNDGSLRPVGIYNWDGTQNDDLVWEKECDIGSEGGNPYCTGAIFENKFKVKYKY